MNLCKCGCGNETKNTFVHGHNQRGTKRSEGAIEKLKAAWADSEKRKEWTESLKKSANRPEFKEALSKFNKGKKLLAEHKSKIGEGNKGCVRTGEVKDKISNSLKGRFVGELNPFWGGGKKMQGESNSNWQGGTSRAYKTGYYSMEYKEWRKAVFMRDNFTCQDCGFKKDKNNYVTAHHIKSFAKFPELRYDITNGVTLCEDCHCKVDNYRARFRNKTIIKQ